jgi:hypothetical protein
MDDLFSIIYHVGVVGFVESIFIVKPESHHPISKVGVCHSAFSFPLVAFTILVLILVFLLYFSTAHLGWLVHLLQAAIKMSSFSLIKLKQIVSLIAFNNDKAKM